MKDNLGYHSSGSIQLIFKMGSLVYLDLTELARLTQHPKEPPIFPPHPWDLKSAPPHLRGSCLRPCSQSKHFTDYALTPALRLGIFSYEMSARGLTQNKSQTSQQQPPGCGSLAWPAHLHHGALVCPLNNLSPCQVCSGAWKNLTNASHSPV